MFAQTIHRAASSKSAFGKALRGLVALIFVLVISVITGPVISGSAISGAPQAFAAEPQSSPQSSPESSKRIDTWSGYPVPRFVSLKSSTTYCRVGPSRSHPKKLTYTKRGLPVRVIAETVDHWRKIEDGDGDRCWVHSIMLTGKPTALVQKDGATLHAKPALGTFIRARLAHGLLARVQKCTPEWCKIQIGKQQGWVEKQHLWGDTQ